MNRLDNIIDNPLMKDLHERQRSSLLEQFPALSRCPHRYFLSLRTYLDDIPQRFFSSDIQGAMSTWLHHYDATERNDLKYYIDLHLHELDRAFLHIEEINAYTWHDSIKEGDDYELIRFIDQEIHPAYLRLTEGVLAPLLRVVAHFSRLGRGKKPEGLDTWNTAEEIARTDLRQAVISYNHTIRNGIAHGGITYLQKEIRYQDGKGSKEKLADTDVIRLFDDLVDSCNALALAFSLFLLTHQQHGYPLPQNLMLNELKAETRTPWWEITGCTPSEFAGLNQLIVYAVPHTSDYGKVQFSTFHSGVLAERFAPGYDRYFFSIRSHGSWPGWAGFDGKKLRKLRSKSEAILEDYKGVLEDNLVFYVPRIKTPKLFNKLHTLFTNVRIHWPLHMSDFRKQMCWHSVNVRNAKIHRNAWGCVLNGEAIFLPLDGIVTQDAIKQSCGMIVRRCLCDARRNTSSYSMTRYLPLGYTRIALFQKDYRHRRLKSFGLAKDLICTIQVQYIRRIRCPDIMGSTIEQKGRYRIAWNSEWLESQGIDHKADAKATAASLSDKNVVPQMEVST